MPDQQDHFLKLQSDLRAEVRPEGALELALSFHKSLRQLRILQTNRIAQSLLPEPLGKGALPATVKATEIVALAKRTHKSWPALAINNLIEVSLRSRVIYSPQLVLDPLCV